MNVPDRELEQTNLVSTVQNALAKSGLDAYHLQIALTEGMLVKDSDKVVATLSRLKEFGVTLSIDDIETRYSRLSYLKRFPLHRLKVNRSFVADITTECNDPTICLAIIAMALNLHFEVVAKGVNVPLQLEFLHRHQCHVVQGHYFSLPRTRQKTFGTANQVC